MRMCIDQRSIIINRCLRVELIHNGNSPQNSNYIWLWISASPNERSYSDISLKFSRHLKSCLYHCVISWWLWVNNSGLQQSEVQHRFTESHSWVVMLKECRPHMRYSTVIQSSLCNCQHQTKACWKPLTCQTPIR